MSPQSTPRITPVKVLHSCWSWLPMTQNWIYSQVKHLPQQTIEAHVACHVTENLAHFPWPNLHIAKPRSLVRRASDYLRRFVGKARNDHALEVAREIRPEILHSHFGDQAWNDLAVSQSLGIPHVATFYGFDVNQLPRSSPLWRRRYDELFAEISAVLCEGPHMEACLAGLGCPEHKIRLMPLGIEMDKLRFVPRQRPDKEPLRVLIAASFREKKGIPYAVAALGRLARDVPLRVTIAGNAGRDRASKQEKQRILAGVREAGLEALTRFLGFVDHDTLCDIALDHDVFVSPSVTAADGDTEGGAPVVIIEMLASGMPVVSTLHCDIPFVAGPQASRFFAAERDVDELESCLRALLAQPTWDSITRPARAHVMAQHDAVQQGTALAQVYHDIVGSNS
jgi:colanic acid/amylovoran biosynthesis glycosyltransferase